MNKKRKGSFNVPNATGKRAKKRVKQRWRKPRGIDNKKRIRKKGHGAVPKIGYKNSKHLRHLHPSYKREALISNEKELDAFNPDLYAIRIRRSVGKRKRAIIIEKAEKLGFLVLNKGR
ncbi:MAG: eL32 family ribosomal protein [Candidatus Anstonellales archaeon]